MTYEFQTILNECEPDQKELIVEYKVVNNLLTEIIGIWDFWTERDMQGQISKFEKETLEEQMKIHRREMKLKEYQYLAEVREELANAHHS